MENFYFMNPEYALGFYWVGILGLISLVVLFVRSRNKPVRTFGSRYSFLGPMRLWFLVILMFALGVTALMKPAIAEEGEIRARGPIELFLVVGVSFSEFAQDWGFDFPSRVEMARREILKLFFSNSLTRGDKVALFIFANGSKRLMPLADFSIYSDKLIRRASSRLVPPSSLIESHFYLAASDIVAALEHLYQSLDFQEQIASEYEGDPVNWPPSYKSNRVVIVFSDGDFDLDFDAEDLKVQEDNEEGDARISYRERLGVTMGKLRERGMKVYTVAIGTRWGVELTDILLRYKKGYNNVDEYGNVIDVVGDYRLEDRDDLAEKGVTSVNTLNLRLLASSTGVNPASGVFLIDEPSDNSLMYLRRSIDSNRSILSRSVSQEGDKELWPWFVVAMVLVFCLGWFIK
jgi:hypothetical protein